MKTTVIRAISCFIRENSCSKNSSNTNCREYPRVSTNGMPRFQVPHSLPSLLRLSPTSAPPRFLPIRGRRIVVLSRRRTEASPPYRGGPKNSFAPPGRFVVQWAYEHAPPHGPDHRPVDPCLGLLAPGGGMPPRPRGDAPSQSSGGHSKTSDHLMLQAGCQQPAMPGQPQPGQKTGSIVDLRFARENLSLQHLIQHCCSDYWLPR